jgi:vitamin B12 transporter
MSKINIYILMAIFMAMVMSQLKAEKSLEEVLVVGEAMQKENESKAITIISKEDIAKSKSKTLVDVLKNVPGVVVSSYGPYQHGAIYMKGASPHATLILVNGVKLSDVSTGSFDIGQIPLTAVERIEVIANSDGVAYGSAASAGAINIITKKASKSIGAEASAEYGSYNTHFEEAGFLGQSENGDHKISVFASNAGSKGYSLSYYDRGGDKDGYEKQSALLSYNYKDLEAFFQFSNSKVDYDPFASLPSRSFPYFYLKDTDGAYNKNQSYTGYLKYSQDLYGFNNNVYVSYAGTKRNEYENYDGMPYLNKKDNDYNSNVFNANYNISTTYLKSGFVKLGVDYEHQELTQEIGKRDYRFRNRISTFGLDEHKESENIMSYYGIIGYKFFDRLNINAGARFNDQQGYNQKQKVNYSSGANYLGDNYKLRANYFVSYKNPNLFELYDYQSGALVNKQPNVFEFSKNDNELKQEKNQGFDIGFDLYLLDNALTSSVTYYNQSMKDLIILDYDISTASTFGEPQRTYVNNGKTIDVQGIFLNNKYRVNSYLALGLGYSFATYSDRLPRRPKHTFTSEVDLTFNKFNFVVDYMYVSKQDDGFDVPEYTYFMGGRPVATIPSQQIGDWYIGSYSLVNITAQYAVTDNLNTYIRAKNVFNKNYQSAYAFQGEKVGVYAGFNWKY